MTIRGKCRHTDGMRDERGCVALDCSCNLYIPTQTKVIPFVQPPRPPLNVWRYVS